MASVNYIRVRYTINNASRLQSASHNFAFFGMTLIACRTPRSPKTSSAVKLH